jgi:hypothetical protein
MYANVVLSRCKHEVSFDPLLEHFFSRSVCSTTMSEQDNNNNKTDDQKKKKVDRKKLSSEYQVPEYIDVEVVEPITHQENGKDSYTTYKINVIVSIIIVIMLIER